MTLEKRDTVVFITLGLLLIAVVALVSVSAGNIEQARTIGQLRGDIVNLTAQRDVWKSNYNELYATTDKCIDGFREAVAGEKKWKKLAIDAGDLMQWAERERAKCQVHQEVGSR